MASLRLLHVADAHLDTPFYGRDEELRRRLREACREAFKNATREAIERDVHALLIAGDLFDDDRLSFATEKFLLEEMSRLDDAGISVFYATGNHDPGRANYRAHNLDWPDNVHLFRSTNPETVTLRNAEGQEIGYVTGAGHNSKSEDTNLARRFDHPSSELPYVGLLHAQVTSASGAEQHDRYAPCTEQDLRDRQFDYWALGHIHTRQRIADGIPAWYAGNTQGRNPRETGPKGVLYVELDGTVQPDPEFIPVAPIVWNEATVSCPPSVSQFELLAERVAEEVADQVDLKDGREHLLRVYLRGESALASELGRRENVRELEERVQTKLEVRRVEIRAGSLVPPVDLDEYRDSPTVLAETLGLIEKLQGDDELLDELCPEEVARRDVEDKRQYLRSLLEGMEERAASILVPEDRR